MLKVFACVLSICSLVFYVFCSTDCAYAAVVSRTGASTSASIGEGTDIANPQHYAKRMTKSTNFHLRVPILEYHQAAYLPGNAIGLRPQQFQSEVAWLLDHHYHTINFGQLYAAMYLGYSLPTNPVLLTFDDGYESVYTNIFPILKQHQMQATIFMVSGYVGLHGRWSMLTAPELRTMERSGLVDVESHTVTHPDLSVVSDRRAAREIAQSAQSLALVTGHPIRFFCYPAGKHRATTKLILEKNGYLLATVQGHDKASALQGPYGLHRIVVYESTSLASFARSLSS